MHLPLLRKCVTALPVAILAIAISGCQTTEVQKAPAKAQLAPAESRNYSVGDKWIWQKSDGSQQTNEIVGLAGPVATIQTSSGCSYKVHLGGFSPGLSWKNCSSSDGQHSVQRTGNIFPLELGKTERWKYNGQNTKGDTWSGVRKCVVKEAMNITVPAGNFDTYRVSCSEASARREYYFSPELKTTVAYIRTPLGSSSMSRQHNELVRFVPAG